jgi:hypothetical protein
MKQDGERKAHQDSDWFHIHGVLLGQSYFRLAMINVLGKQKDYNAK